MKLYRTTRGIVIERNGAVVLLERGNWDEFVNDDDLFQNMVRAVQSGTPTADAGITRDLLPPMQSQEIWASGVTYYRSKVERQKESKEAGGSDFYARVYEAERPELFFKAGAHRTVGSGGTVRIRRDSSWNVPEPELTLMITSSGKIVGYTIGNDMSSRSIEGENPLYLPQAKTYDGCASVGPCLYVPDALLDPDTMIRMRILRNGVPVFEGEVALRQMKRTREELVAFLFRESSFPYGCLLMTGTGIVPQRDFTLRKDDEIHITIDPVGTLINFVG